MLPRGASAQPTALPSMWALSIQPTKVQTNSGCTGQATERDEPYPAAPPPIRAGAGAAPPPLFQVQEGRRLPAQQTRPSGDTAFSPARWSGDTVRPPARSGGQPPLV
ncbi:hypothetical protein ZWY2020_019988 [Hordeum vulgare]|nr:hypothetical protein ZWY2020_019988 [Hordeum vulgare]